ncbi:16238_t:CDS:1 [Acaulospora morrowiae]|uniref:16238_t:CDS:1 n=1 Tax=Acaulospora morrowiae TaxID=94023 RepID=A0A9N9CN53_9GLOM|nr:16238_t:CDS:1 [Acaulospora morrowiae]
MEEQWDKIRSQIDSKLDNQRQIAVTLLAIEETIKEQNVSLTPVAYFGTLMTMLEEQSKDVFKDSKIEIRRAILYLLNIILPHLAQTILRNKFSQILPILLETLENDKNDASIVRSATGCLETLIIAQEFNAWSQPILKKGFQSLLILSVDQRPKPRKRAHDAVRKILNSSLSSSLSKHPAIGITSEFCLGVIKEHSKSDRQSVIHILSLLKGIVGKWPVSALGKLFENLLHLPKLNDMFLTIATFQVFEELFHNGENNLEMNALEELLKALFDLMPNKQDAQLLPHWLMIVSNGFSAYAKANSNGYAKMFVDFFTAIFSILEVDDQNILVASTNCLSSLIMNGISDDIIQQKVLQPESDNLCLDVLIRTVEGGFNFRYQSAWPCVLEISKALFQRLHRSSQKLLINLLKIVGDVRMDPSFELKEQADRALGAAIASMGPQLFLSVLPLNLQNSENDTGRAWLLPLLKDHITNTELGYFFSNIVPLAERLDQLSSEFRNDNRMIESKVYDTLVQQVWALLPGFCDLPIDLPTSFTGVKAELLGNVIYKKPELRPTIASALENLVEKNKIILNSDEKDEELFKKYHLNKASAKLNVEHLVKYSANYLAVFFNVFNQTPLAYRGYILDVIKVYLTITPAKEISKIFGKVVNLLKQSLANHKPLDSNDQTSSPPMSYTMLDLSVAMIPHLDAKSIGQLCEVVLSLLCNDDPTLQKKSYKILNNIMESDNGKLVILQDIKNLQSKLLDATMASAPAAKKDRLLVLTNTIKLLPSSDLHMIPDVLSEAILCTKEVNEKARTTAYELLVVMCNKMKEGGIIIMSKVTGADQTLPNAQASIDEFVFNMVVAGLAATTPHMISATITALSRLVFEFKNDLDKSRLHQLISTIDNFVNCTNREIVKSALGFVKVITISLDAVFLESHLSQIILGILTWSNEHKSHFKVKVRHIFERLIRRFGYDIINNCVPETDKKLLVNIRKRKDRAKRKKSAAQTTEIDDESGEQSEKISHSKNKPLFNSAYEEALYGSESDLEDSDEGVEPKIRTKPLSKQDKKSSKSWIKEDTDSPVDFLDKGVISKVIGVDPTIKKNSKGIAFSFKESGDGRMIINESDEEISDMPNGSNSSDVAMQEAEDHYREAKQSADGFTRSQNNKIKFNKRNRDGDMELDEIEPIDAIAKRRKKNKQAKKVEIIGKEYKAKHAEGDIKRKGKPDPYAYVPLASMYRKKGQKVSKLSITMKGKVHKRNPKVNKK